MCVLSVYGCPLYFCIAQLCWTTLFKKKMNCEKRARARARACVCVCVCVCVYPPAYTHIHGVFLFVCMHMYTWSCAFRTVTACSSARIKFCSVMRQCLMTRTNSRGQCWYSACSTGRQKMTEKSKVKFKTSACHVQVEGFYGYMQIPPAPSHDVLGICQFRQIPADALNGIHFEFKNRILLLSANRFYWIPVQRFDSETLAFFGLKYRRSLLLNFDGGQIDGCEAPKIFQPGWAQFKIHLKFTPPPPPTLPVIVETVT